MSLEHNNYEKVNVLQVESEVDSFTEDRYRQFYKNFPVNVDNVLDIGCNTGRGGNNFKGIMSEIEISRN